jgi:hypothetical protein
MTAMAMRKSDKLPMVASPFRQHLAAALVIGGAYHALGLHMIDQVEGSAVGDPEVALQERRGGAPLPADQGHGVVLVLRHCLGSFQVVLGSRPVLWAGAPCLCRLAAIALAKLIAGAPSGDYLDLIGASAPPALHIISGPGRCEVLVQFHTATP